MSGADFLSVIPGITLNMATEDPELAEDPPSVLPGGLHGSGVAMKQSGSGNTQQHTDKGNIYSSGEKQYNAHTQVFVNAEDHKDQKESCLSALFLTNPRDDRDKLVNTKGSRVNGTCEWIKANPVYESWLQSHSQLLWLSGGPGMGKSMIAIFLAEELEIIVKGSQNTSFLQYFCDNKDEKRNTAVAILRGLIFQILELQPKLFHHILPSFKIQKKNLFTSSSFEPLWRIFESMICDPILGNIYCVVDGLDECDEASLEVLLKKFAALLLRRKSDRSSACHFNLLVLSRDLPEFIPDILNGFPRIGLDPDAKMEVDSDINRFINEKVDDLSAKIKYPDKLSEHVKEVFQKRAQGTFLWIGIVAKALERYKVTEVQDALNSFPAGLDGVYARILLQIDIRRLEMAARILRWVVMALRPLTLSELSTAVEATVGPSVDFSSDEVMKDIVSYCGYFLTIKENEVNLIHQSAKDYLLRKAPDSNPKLEAFRVKEEAANLEIARRCFYYLQDGALADGPVDLGNTTRLEAFPLLSYAAIYWPEHSRTLARSEDIFDLSKPFYNKKSEIRESWVKSCWNTKGWRIDTYPFPTLLHLASDFGILPLAQNLLLKSSFINKVKLVLELNKVDNYGRTALMIAAGSGHEAIVQLLLEKGANINAKMKNGITALHSAAVNGHKLVVKLLLEKGAKIGAKDSIRETAITGAAFRGHEAVVRLLLEKGANIETKGFGENTALIQAASGGHEAVVRLLLEKGANIEAKEWGGNRALINAAGRGHAAVVRLLLEKGANIEAKGWSENTAIIEAASGGHEAIVRLLLETEANIEAKAKCEGTALTKAAEKGHAAVVRLLLETGANIEAKARFEGTALTKAASEGHASVVRLLLETGANIEAKARFEGTALIQAAFGGHAAVVQLLVEKGANIEAKDRDGNTVLTLAAWVGLKEAVQLLLEKGANIEAKNSDGNTALILAAAARPCDTAVVQQLLEKGANIEANGSDGNTALIKAASEGHEAIVRLLLEKGANVEAKNNLGKTARYYAVKGKHKAVLQLLSALKPNSS